MLMFFCGTDCLLDNLIFGYSFIQISNHNLFFYKVNNSNVTSNIEFNGSWTHGPHPFDPLNKDDINLLKKWKLKNTKYYCIAINTWTIRDVNKRNIAKYNNINIKEFWKVSELINFLKEI